MWDEIKQQQLDALRRREMAGALTAEERRQLDQLLGEIEQEEWISLRPALERLRHERERTQSESAHIRMQNAVLAVLVEREEDLLARAKVQLAILLNEQNVIQAEYERTIRLVTDVGASQIPVVP